MLMQAGRTVRFGAVGDEGPIMGEEDEARLDDLHASQNNTQLTNTRHIGAQGSRMLAALFEGIEADFLSLVSAIFVHSVESKHLHLLTLPTVGRWLSNQRVHTGGHGVEIPSIAVHAHAGRNVGMEAASSR